MMRRAPFAPREDAATALSGNRANDWLLVGLLTLVGVLNYFDRELPFILAESIKRDLHLSDAAVGFINGFGFLLIYAVCGLPISRMADRGNQSRILAGCVALWSVMTAVGSVAANGWQLAVARMGVAVGEAGSTPTAHAVVAGRFSASERGKPLAIISTSAAIGAMLGLALGGHLNDAFGWRATFALMAVPGLTLALAVYVVIPSVAVDADRPTRSFSAALKDLTRTPGFVRVILAAGLMSIGTSAQTVFAPSFLMRSHAMTASAIGLQYGVTKGVLGITGLVAGGFLIDRLSKRDIRWIVWLPAAAIMLSLPLSLTVWHVSDARIVIVMLSVINAAGLFYLAPVFSAAQALALPDQRALASAMALLAISVMSGAGPLAVGLISDARAASGTSALSDALLIVVPTMHLVGALAFIMAGPRFASGVRWRAAAHEREGSDDA